MTALERYRRWLRFFALTLRDANGSLRNRAAAAQVITRAVLAQAGWQGPPREVTVRLQGQRFRVDAGRRDISAYPPIWIDGEYAPDPRFRLAPGATVLDVGAQVGFFAVHAALAIGPQGRVYAFEPDPGSFRRLAANVGGNGLSQCEAVWSAVGAEVGDIGFETRAHSVDSRVTAGRGDVRVPLVTLDHFAAARKLGAIDCLKIDAELAEVDVVRGARATLPRVRAAIVEIHRPGEVAEIDAAMAEAGLQRVHAAGKMHFYLRDPA